MGTCVLQGNKTNSLASCFCFKSERNNSYKLLISLTKKNTFSSLKSTAEKYSVLGIPVYEQMDPMVQLSKPWTWHNCTEWPTSMEVESLWAFHSQSSSGLYLQKLPSDQHAPWCRKAFLPTKSGSFLLVAVAGKIRTGVNL